MDRFQLYKDILAEKPVYLRAVKQTEEELQLQTDTRLYLYAMVPALVEFVSWVLEEAVKSGKKRLYFLSRDGYQMYHIALRLLEIRKLPIECRYLHVSRYAMRVPEYHLNLQKCLDRICVGGIDITLEKVLKRAALTTEEAVETIFDIGWQDKYQEILNYRQIQELKQSLKQQERLFVYIERHSKEEYENAMGYLEQEGLLSESPYAIVDSGWVGTLQQSMQTLVSSKNPNIRMEGYYFGLYELPAEADVSGYHAYYFTPDRGLQRKAHFSNSLFETICSANEGMTTGYFNSEGKYIPRLDMAENPNKEQMERNLAALEVFLSHYEETEAQALELIVERLFDSLMSSPTEAEVEAYGDNLFSDDVLEGSLKKVAAELTEEQIRNQFFLNKLLILAGMKKATIHESAWIEGSIVKCGRQKRSNLRHARFYKYFVYFRKQITSRKK